MGFGIRELDNSFGGLYQGELMAVVGAPGSMKTSLALNAVDDYLSRYNGNCLFFSLDMSAIKVQERRMLRKMDCFLFEFHQMVKNGDPRVAKAIEEMTESDNGRLTLIGKPRGGRQYSWEEISNIISQVGPELVIVDYLTLIGGWKSEMETIQALMPKFKGIADDFGTAMILLSQMGRASRTSQKVNSGGHGAGGHWLEDAVDIEIELLKQRSDNRETNIIASVTKTRKTQSGDNFQLGLVGKTMSFEPTARQVEREKKTANVFEI